MTLVYVSRGTKRCAVLVECPVCGADLSGGGSTRTAHLRTEHGPTDFGLSPLGDRSAASTTRPTAHTGDADRRGGVPS